MNDFLGKKNVLLFSFLTFLFPLGMSSIRHYSSTLFVLLSLCGLWCLVVDREKLPLCLYKIEWAFVLFCVLTSLSLINAEDFAHSLKVLSKLAYVLALIFLFKFVKKSPHLIFKAFLWGLVFSGPFNFFIALYSVYIQNIPRAQGYYNSIVFGDLMILSAMLLITVLSTGFFKSKTCVIVVVFSAICFFIASYLSGTRGSWIAVPLTLPIILFLSWKYFYGKQFLRIVVGISFLFVVGVGGVIYMANGCSNLNRLSRAVENLSLYVQDGKSANSVGQRFVLWGIACDMFQKNPLIGVGLGAFKSETAKQLANKDSALVVCFPHAHSIYFEFLGTTGILGFLSMLTGFFIVPAWVFIRALTGSELQKISAAAGLVLLGCFSIFGLTECWIFRSPMLISYLFCLGVLSVVCAVDETICPE